MDRKLLWFSLVPVFTLASSAFSIDCEYMQSKYLSGFTNLIEAKTSQTEFGTVRFQVPYPSNGVATAMIQSSATESAVLLWAKEKFEETKVSAILGGYLVTVPLRKKNDATTGEGQSEIVIQKNIDSIESLTQCPWTPLSTCLVEQGSKLVLKQDSASDPIECGARSLPSLNTLGEQ